MDSNAKISGSTLRIADICTNETYTVDCNGSCKSGVCDGYACRTGECIVRTIEFVSCGNMGGGETGSGDNVGDGGSGGSGSNTSSSYIYSPNNFEQNDSNEINRINDLKRDAIWSAMTTNMQYYFSSNYNKALLFNETIQYQIDNNWSQDSYDFGQDIINLAANEQNQIDVNDLMSLTLKLEYGKTALFEDNFGLTFISYGGIAPSTANSNIIVLNTFLNYKKLRQLNPEWSRTKCAWEASREIIHISLDIFGLIPVGGEVADLINGVLYTIEGEGLNATLSYASTLPIIGWASAGKNLD